MAEFPPQAAGAPTNPPLNGNSDPAFVQANSMPPTGEAAKTLWLVYFFSTPTLIT